MKGTSSLIGGTSSDDSTGEVTETPKAPWKDLCPPLLEMILERLAITDSTGEVTVKTQRASWKDLCPPLLEMILDRLPITDYLRFAAVCASWRDVQHDHRHCQAHRKKCQMPWLISLEEEIFYNLFEQRYYRISLPKEVKGNHCIGVSHGWLIFLNKVRPTEGRATENWLFLVNPFTGSRITFPMVSQIADTFYPWRENSVIGVLSTFPTDPDFVALFGRLNNQPWLYNARYEMWRILYTEISEPVYCQGAFYWLEHCYRKLEIVETDLTTFITKRIEIDLARPMDGYFLVQSDGKLLVTGFIRFWGNQIKDFIVFEVDLSQGVLMRLESLGDRVLFYNNVNRESALCVSSDDTGGPGNRIYYVTESTYLWDEYPGQQWIEYDYASHEVINRTLLNLKKPGRENSKYDDFLRWIMPTLD